jgi:hypothetical protein
MPRSHPASPDARSRSRSPVPLASLCLNRMGLLASPRMGRAPQGSVISQVIDLVSPPSRPCPHAGA